ncbi:hypothetical protein DVH05_003007 [Phytophthora capsici]|nr:hypothetical protein DVH05_003007 [Phytophthora capsici]
MLTLRRGGMVTRCHRHLFAARTDNRSSSWSRARAWCVGRDDGRQQGQAHGSGTGGDCVKAESQSPTPEEHAQRKGAAAKTATPGPAARWTSLRAPAARGATDQEGVEKQSRFCGTASKPANSRSQRANQVKPRCATNASLSEVGVLPEEGEEEEE